MYRSEDSAELKADEGFSIDNEDIAKSLVLLDSSSSQGFPFSFLYFFLNISVACK